jgi:hypothetical protein
MTQSAVMLPRSGNRPKLAHKVPKVVPRKDGNNTEALKEEVIGFRMKFILGQSYNPVRGGVAL